MALHENMTLQHWVVLIGEDIVLLSGFVACFFSAPPQMTVGFSDAREQTGRLIISSQSPGNQHIVYTTSCVTSTMLLTTSSSRCRSICAKNHKTGPQRLVRFLNEQLPSLSFILHTTCHHYCNCVLRIALLQLPHNIFLTTVYSQFP